MRICRLLLQYHFLPTKSWWVLPILPGAYIVRNIIIIMCHKKEIKIVWSERGVCVLRL